MKICNVQNYQNQTTVFKKVNKKNKVPISVIQHLGLNLETMVGYSGKKTILPAPKNIRSGLANFLNNLQVNWATHVTKKSK